MGLRDRRAARREEREAFGRGGTARRYQMRQKLVSIGDDYWIENDEGDRVFRVNGKALRMRNTLDLEDPDGRSSAGSRPGSSTSATRWPSRTRTVSASRWCTRR